MLPSSTTPHVLVASPNEQTLRFPIKLLVRQQTFETTALVDSGTMDWSGNRSVYFGIARNLTGVTTLWWALQIVLCGLLMDR